MNCMVCGTKMINTVGGNYKCPTCGHAMNDLVYRPSNCDLPMPQGFGEQKGWICPVCGRGLAPWTSCCPCINTQEIIYNSKMDEETFSLNGTNSIVSGTNSNIEVKI